jgi:hypothetical protein
MTVEACMIMPLVLMVYLFLIQYAVWVYDRCMLEFDTAAVLLRSAASKEPKITYQRERATWDKDKFIRLHSQEMTWEEGMLSLKVVGRAEGGSMGEVGVSYEMWQIEPEQWLRGKRKLDRNPGTGEREVE